MHDAPDLYEIVKRCGGGQVYEGGRAAVVRGPGHSIRDRSLSLRVTDEGRLIFYSHANDPNFEVMRWLGIEARSSDSRSSKEEWARMQRAREADRRRNEEANRAFCMGVWEGTVPLGGTAVETYLASRELFVEDSPEIRFHPACPRAKPRPAGQPEPPPHPAMVALVRDPQGRPRALHATYLTPAGSKAFGDRSRLMFGDVRGGAVRLGQVRSDGVLAIAEGIETAGSFMVLRGVPTWAVLSTSGIRNFEPPFGLSKLIVAADSDDKSDAWPDGAGMAAAADLGERARKRCPVEVFAAPDGKDWNDVLRVSA